MASITAQLQPQSQSARPMEAPLRMGSSLPSSSAAAPSSKPSYTLFPPIPAPLQRLFDLVPLVTYPSNVLPGDCDADSDGENHTPDDVRNVPTLYVFIDPADAVDGRASFNPTCLKWQAFLRFAGVPVRLAASSNHASPSGALPFLQPPRVRVSAQQPQLRPPRPIPAREIPAYAKVVAAAASTVATLDALAAVHPRAPAYQALLDTSLRRAWLHAVYLDTDDGISIATRLYANTASASSLVQHALARQLTAAAAAEVWGQSHAHVARASARATAQLYHDAATALAALATLLDEAADAPYFFGRQEPSLFDAAVFSYTHLLLEDDSNANCKASYPQPICSRFRWHNRTLPDLVRAHPRLVQHHANIMVQFWTETPAASPSCADDHNVAESVSWVRV